MGRNIFRAVCAAFYLLCLQQQVSLAATAAQTDPVPIVKDAVPNTGSFGDAVKAEDHGGQSEMSPARISGGSAAAAAPFTEVKVEKATGDNAYTVQEIFAKNKELAGKVVRVRGKIVKYNPGIMGKNWIHIQDGTGEPLHSTHDLVVTSASGGTVGEIVTVQGKLAADKDFGAGYTYTAIIEEGTLVK